MTNKFPSPKVLTVDDGQQIVRSNKSDYAFWFSPDINDWISSKPMRHKRLIKRLKDEGR